MSKRRSKGFTLIELIAVLVIMAIIALIVTPLVLNVVRKAKDSANKRSVDAYGKSIDLAVASYLIEKGDFPTSVDQLTIEYSGKEVVCGVAKLNEDSSVYLSECTVGGKEVKDSSADDGWYHYGKLDKVVYQTYSIGDEVTYNGMNFYVIADSDENSDSVTMLKAEPLTVDEVNTYGAGHINRYTYSSVGTAYNNNGYGGMTYYSSETCGYPNGSSGSSVTTGCTTDYAQSEVKYAVDAWAKDKFQASDLSVDTTGYSVRLITYDELINNLGYNNATWSVSHWQVNPEYTPSWVYNSNYEYWTMSQNEDSDLYVWGVRSDGYLSCGFKVYNYYHVVRPVVTFLKSAL